MQDSFVGARDDLQSEGRDNIRRWFLDCGGLGCLGWLIGRLSVLAGVLSLSFSHGRMILGTILGVEEDLSVCSHPDNATFFFLPPYQKRSAFMPDQTGVNIDTPGINV